MILIGFICTICLIFAWLLIKWHQMKMFWLKKGVPHTPVHPIFGSLTFLQRVNPNIWLLNIYNKYPFPYIGIWVFWRPGLIINSPDIAQNILVKHSDKFRNRLVGTGKKDDLGSLNLFTVNDPLWSSIRKNITPTFTSAKLRSWQDLFRSKSDDLIERIKSDNEKGIINNLRDPLWSSIRKNITPTFTSAKLRSWQDLFRSKSDDLIERIKSDNEKGIINNLRPLFADYATDIIGESAFGIKCEATKTRSGPLREMTKEFEKYSTYRGLQWSSIFFFPELADILGFTFWPKHTMVYFKKVFRMIVKERGGYEKETDGKKDLMDALLKMKQDSIKNNKNLDEVVVISNAMIFLQGGYDTSSTVLTYITYELAYHPEYQDILHKELMDIKNKTGNYKFETNDLAELPYLNAVIKETMRIYPVMGWLDRVALQDYQVDENLTIPAGTAVLINVQGMQLDSKYYPDPKQFKPERFLPDNERNITPYTYMPFGEGPRHCIGKRFGLFSVRFALAAMVDNFVFKPIPGRPEPNDLVFDRKGIFAQPGDVMSVEFIPRH